MDAKVSSISNSSVLPVGERASPAQTQLSERIAQVDRAARPEASRSEAVRPSDHQKPAAADLIRDLRLQFRVDPKTNDIVVLMIDRATRRVVRAIPPQELAKFDKGQLLELIA